MVGQGFGRERDVLFLVGKDVEVDSIGEFFNLVHVEPNLNFYQRISSKVTC